MFFGLLHNTLSNICVIASIGYAKAIRQPDVKVDPVFLNTFCSRSMQDTQNPALALLLCPAIKLQSSLSNFTRELTISNFDNLIMLRRLFLSNSAIQSYQFNLPGPRILPKLQNYVR